MNKRDYGVLLVNPLPYNDYSLSESLGIEYLDAILLEAGYSSRVLVDRSCELGLERMLAEIQEVRFLGYTMYSESVDYVFGMATGLKAIRPDIHICVGGPLSCFCAEQILGDCKCIDSVVIGEACETIVDLVECLRIGNTLSTCAGLCYRISAEEICWTSPRKAIVDMDAIPFPTRTVLKRDQGVLVAYITTSTGCVGNCVFCVESAIFKHVVKTNPHVKRVRYRSVDKVVSELVTVMSETDFDTFEIVDSSFEGYGDCGKSRLEEFADKIIEKKLPCYFICNFRADSFHKEDNSLLSKLSNAGVCLVFIGVESGCDPTLRYFRKRAKVMDNLRTIRLLREHGFAVEIGFIMFHPKTTFAELRENTAFLAEAGFAWDVDLYVSRLALYPGAPIVGELLAKGSLLKSTYSYRRPHDYDFADSGVGAFVSYLERWNPNTNLAIDISIPILQTEVLISKVRKIPGAFNICERWGHRMNHIKQEFGMCNARWFLSCINIAEKNAADVERLDRVGKRRIGEIKEKELASRVREIEREITLELRRHSAPYVTRQSPWGDVIYPKRIFDLWQRETEKVND